MRDSRFLSAQLCSLLIMGAPCCSLIHLRPSFSIQPGHSSRVHLESETMARVGCPEVIPVALRRGKKKKTQRRGGREDTSCSLRLSRRQSPRVDGGWPRQRLVFCIQITAAVARGLLYARRVPQAQPFRHRTTVRFRDIRLCRSDSSCVSNCGYW